MRKLTYLAVLEPSREGYGVFFPDMPGCISYGRTILEAQKNAKEALELHVYGMEIDGEELPDSVGDIEQADLAKGSIIMAIEIFPGIVRTEMENKRVKTNVTIPFWLKRIAEERHVNYSRLLETALLEYLGLMKEKR